MTNIKIITGIKTKIKTFRRKLARSEEGRMMILGAVIMNAMFLITPPEAAICATDPRSSCYFLYILAGSLSYSSIGKEDPSTAYFLRAAAIITVLTLVLKAIILKSVI